MPSASQKLSFNDIIKAIVPDQLEAAYADVEKFVARKAKQFSDKEAKEFAALLKKLMDQSGTQAENALYYLLCDPTNVARADIKKAMENGTKAGIALVVTMLVGQFALAPATALIIASIVVKIVAAKGHEKVCAELKARKADKGDPTPKPAAPAASVTEAAEKTTSGEPNASALDKPAVS
jgi:hypothetical protein